MACLDTTILVDLNRTRSEFAARAARKIVDLNNRGEKLVTTRFNVAELYLGVQLAQDRQRETQHVRKLLAAMEILDFDDRAAWLFGEITAEQQRLGRPIGDLDSLIAATALAAGHRLITRNTAHFADIRGLSVEDY